MPDKPLQRIAAPPCPSAAEIAQAVRAGESSAEAETRAALDRIAPSESQVGAWQHLNPDQAVAAARRVDQAVAKGPLPGVPVAVKDIIDTADMPTENGTAIDAGRQPYRDATVVARLRAAGAVILGKTVTTECAVGRSGKTRNPHDLSRTPGGSSSGSAAAVAAGMVSLALGTQTAGSVIRPAAYCGVWGMKPSFGLVPATGVLRLSHTLDHVGAFAASAEDLALAIDAISGEDGVDEMSTGHTPTRLTAGLRAPRDKPRLAFLPSPTWRDVEPACRERYEAMAKELDAKTLDMGDEFADVVAVYQTIMLREVAHYVGGRYGENTDRLSPMLRERLVRGQSIDGQTYLQALARLNRMRVAFARVLGDHDAAITPGAAGEAPLGLDSTGSRNLSLIWTSLAGPAVNVPGLSGPTGLPLGVQVVGRIGTDAQTLRGAAWIGAALGAVGTAR